MLAISSEVRNNLYDRVVSFVRRSDGLAVNAELMRIQQIDDCRTRERQRQSTARDVTNTSTPYVCPKDYEENENQYPNVETHCVDLYDVRPTTKSKHNRYIPYEHKDKSAAAVTAPTSLNAANVNVSVNVQEMVDLTDDSFRSDEQMTDFYLVLSVKQSLAASKAATGRVSIGDQHLWKAVHKKIKYDYSFDLVDEINCQIRFEHLFCQYLKVLQTSTSLFGASRQFHCFDLFDEIDFEAVKDQRHGLVSQLKQRMRANTRIEKKTTSVGITETTVITDSLSDWSDWSE